MARSQSKNLLSAAAFARKHDVSPATVSRWRHAGWLVIVKGCVDAAASETRLAERVRTYRGGEAKGPAGGDAAPANVITELATIEPSPPALRPKISGKAVLNGIAGAIGAMGRLLPGIAIQAGCSARMAYIIDMALASAMVDAADEIADRTLPYPARTLAPADWALEKLQDLPDSWWAAAAAKDGDVYDEDAWLVASQSPEQLAVP